MSNDEVDFLTIESVKYFISKHLNARVDTWDKLMIIPERLHPMMAEVTHGRIMKLPNLQRFLILKYCLNSKETFGMSFPFISDEDDLQTYDSQSPTVLFLHVKDLPQHLFQR